MHAHWVVDTSNGQEGPPFKFFIGLSLIDRHPNSVLLHWLSHFASKPLLTLFINDRKTKCFVFVCNMIKFIVALKCV